MTDRLRGITPHIPAKVAAEIVARMTPERQEVFRNTLIATSRLNEHITDVEEIHAINSTSIAEGLAVALTTKAK